MKNTLLKGFGLALSFAVMMVSFVSAATMTIDGNIADWSALVQIDPLDTSPAEADITRYSTTRDTTYIYLMTAIDSSGNSGSYMTYTLDGATTDYLIQVNIRDQGQNICTIPEIIITNLGTNTTVSSATVTSASAMIAPILPADVDNDCFAEIRVPLSIFPANYVYSRVLFGTQPSSSNESAPKEIVVPLNPTAIEIASSQAVQFFSPSIVVFLLLTLLLLATSLGYYFKSSRIITDTQK